MKDLRYCNLEEPKLPSHTVTKSWNTALSYSACAHTALTYCEGCYKVYYFCVESCNELYLIMYLTCCRCQTLQTVNMENCVQILLQKAVGGCRWSFVCVSVLSSSFKLLIIWYDKQDKSSLCIFQLIHAVCVLGMGGRQPAKYHAGLRQTTLTLTYVWGSRSLHQPCR